MSRTIRKWLGILLSIMMLVSNLAAYAEVSKLTVSLVSADKEKNGYLQDFNGVEFGLYLVGVPDSAAESGWKGAPGFESVKFPKSAQTDHVWTDGQMEKMMDSIDGLISLKSMDPQLTQTINNGVASFDSLEPGIYYCVRTAGTGPKALEVDPVLVALPADNTDSPNDVIAKLGDKLRYNTPEPTHISVEKVWEDADDYDGIRTSITVRLLCNGKPAPASNRFGDITTEVVLTAKNGWAYTWGKDNKELLEKTDLQGNTNIYSVEEVEVPRNYVATVAPITEDGKIVVTNKHTPKSGALRIEKVLEADSDELDLALLSGKEFTFIINGPAAADLEKQGLNKTDKNSLTDHKETVKVVKILGEDIVKGSKTLDGLTPGHYTVTEVTEDLDAMGVKLLSEESVTVEVVADDTVGIHPAKFTNQQLTGGLKIEKTVKVNGADTETDLVDGEYWFTVSGPGDTGLIVRNIPLKITDGKGVTETVEGLLPGEYTVVENTSNLKNGVQAANKDAIKVQVEAGKVTATAASFENYKDYGELVIRKSVTVDGKTTKGTLADGDYFFSVTGPNNYKVENIKISVTNGVSNTATLSLLEPGTYTVTETGTLPSGMEAEALTVTHEVKTLKEVPTPVEFAFVNNLTTGSLKIVKKVTVDTKETTGTLADGEYTFRVTGPDAFSDTVTLTIENGKTKENEKDTLTGLKPGTYTITETGTLPTGMKVDHAEQTVPVESAAVAEVTFTNDLTTGSLTIKKSVTVDGKTPADDTVSLADGDYTFEVLDNNKNVVGDIKLTIKDGISQSDTLTGLKPGIYTINETGIDKLPEGMSLVGTNGRKATVKPDDVAEAEVVEFKNDLTTGKLTIIKNVRLNGRETDGDLVDGDYTFTVTGPDGFSQDVPLQIRDGKSASKTLENLKPGDYTVTEKTDGLPVGVTVDGEATQTVHVKPNATEKANFTNKKDTGSLEIVKKVTVDKKATKTTLADGDYTFEVTDEGGEIVDTFTLTITEGASDNYVLNDLLPGKYTIKETSELPAGMTVDKENGQETVEVKGGANAKMKVSTFTNNLTTGSLKLTKKVTVNGQSINTDAVDGDYIFYITGPDGYHATETLTIKNGKSAEKTLSGLKPGTYTVTEDTDNLADGVALVETDGVTAEVESGKTAEATLTNNKDFGALKIEKLVTVNGKAPEGNEADGVYKFVVTGPYDYRHELELTVTGGESVSETLENLPAGKYTIQEDRSNLPAGMVVKGDGVTVDVTRDHTATKPMTVSVTNDLQYDSLTIVKNVTLNGEATDTSLVDGDYIFNVTGPNNYKHTVQLTITKGVSSSEVLTNLVPGTYQVTEVTTGLAAKNIKLVGGNETVTRNVIPNGKAIAEFTNNKDAGSLTITKKVTVDGAETQGTLADGTYTFAVTGPNNYRNTVTLKVVNGEQISETLVDLRPGDYTVKETSNLPAGMAVDKAEGETVAVAAGKGSEPVEVIFTNNMATGSLKIVKKVTVNGTEPDKLPEEQQIVRSAADGEYTFTITGPNGYKSTKDLWINNGVSDEAIVSDLVPGVYTVHEETKDFRDGLTVKQNDIRVTVTAGNTADVPTAEFVNDQGLGSLKFTKKVTVNGSATTTKLVDGTYKFDITGPNGFSETYDMVVEDGKYVERYVDLLFPGEYTITEHSDLPEGVSLVGENGRKVTVTAYNTANVPSEEFVNNRDVASLTITKAVTVDKETTTTTLADGTYTFSVSGPNGYNETVSLEIKNGASKSQTLENLVPGWYTITETSALPNGMTPDTWSQTIEITAENTGAKAEPIAVSFTNDQTTGSLKLTKKVTVNGQPTTSTDVDGDYEFRVSGPNYDKLVTLTVKNGVSAEQTLDKLLPGTYTVTEETEGLKAGVKPVGNNVVTTYVGVGATAEATITNNIDFGSLIINKSVTVDGNAPDQYTLNVADGDYVFNVTGQDGYKQDVTLTIKDGKSTSTTLEKLQPGVYTIQETTTRDGMTVTPANGMTVYVSANNYANPANIPVARFTNDQATGSLSIVKNVTVNGAATTSSTADGTYAFKVTGPYGYEATESLTIHNGVSAEVTLDYLKPGVYTVTELTSSLPTGMSLVGSNDVKINVTANNETNMPVASFTNNKEVGVLRITKRVTVNGSATTRTYADGTYTFTVTGPNDYSRTVTISVVNGQSNSVTLRDLPLGKYKVTESSTLPSGMKIASGNNEEKTLAVTHTATAPLDFTVTNDLTRTTTPPGTTTRTATPVVTTTNTPTPTPSTSVTPEVTPSDSPSETPDITPTPTPVPTDTPEPTPTPTPVTNVDVRKVWQGDDNNAHNTRPRNITVNLLRNGVQIDSATFSGNANGWFYRFSNLPAVDENGNYYNYSIREVPVDGYETTLNGNTITNRMIMPNVVYKSVRGVKRWEDEGYESQRPAGVVVELLRDGRVYRTSSAVTADNNWAFEFNNLEETDGFDHVYNYEVREIAVDGYYSRITREGDNFIVTNYRLPGEEEYFEFDDMGTPLAGFEGDDEGELEELLELFDYGTPLWGERLLPTGDDMPIYPIVFGGIGAAALAALAILMLFGRKKEQGA